FRPGVWRAALGAADRDAGRSSRVVGLEVLLDAECNRGGRAPAPAADAERDARAARAQPDEECRQQGEAQEPVWRSDSAPRKLALGSVQVVARRTPAGDVAELLLDPKRLFQVLPGLLCVARAEVQRAELVVRKGFSC